MAKREKQYPNNPQFDNFSFDFSQYGEAQTPQTASKEEPGFWEKAYNSGGALLEGLTYVPGDVWDTIKNAWNGGEIDVTDRNAIEERRRRDAEKQAYQQKWEGKTFEGLTDAMNSIGYSVGTVGASLGAGLAAAPAGPVAAGAAALGASGTLAYRATKDDFMHRLYDETENTLGREPTQEEWNRVANEFDSEATRYGLWEAGPEALSNLFMGKLLGPLGKGLFKSGIGGFVKRTLGMAGEELGTETATQMGQGKVEAELGWRDEAPGVKEAFLEVAPATLWQMGLMAGGKKAADIAYNRLSKRKEAVENNIDETQQKTPEQAQPQQQSIQALPEGSQAPLELPVGQNIEMGWEGTGYGPIAPDAISPETQAGLYGAWDNLNGQQQSPQQEIAPQVRQGLFGAWDDYAQSQQPQQAEKQILYRPQREGLFGAWDQMLPQPIQPSIQEQMNSGETVDLLNPQEAQPQSGPTPEIEPAPIVAEQEQVAPPQLQPQNQIAQQPIQPVSPEGIMGGIPGFQETPVPQVAPQAIPTQSAITNTQQTPRADTQAQAAQLGMPAPQAVPQAALPEQQLPQLPQLPQAQTAPQSPLAGLSVMQDSGLQASPMPAPTSNGIGTAIELPANEGVENAGQEKTSEQGTPGLQQRDGGSDVQMPDGNEGRPAEGRTGESSERPSEQQGEGRNKRKLKIPNRPDEGVSFEIREADDVQASHLPEAGFQKNPRYQLENERRYHDEPASRDDVLDHAKDLDPDMLMESIDASQGAPIIDRQGNVLGGNSRAMSIRHAYEKFPQRAEAYRQALKERAENLGIDPAQIDKMKRPMLVRSMDRDMDAQERQSMVSALNDTFTKSKDKRASGKSRGDRLSPRTLDALGRGMQEADSLREFFDQSESASVVEMLIKDGVIQSTERTALVAEDGLLNPDGKKIVEEALRGRVAKSYEALDALPAAVVGKIDAAIPYVLIAENIGNEWNITPHVQDAVDLVAEFQASKSDTPQAFLKQLDMTKGGKAPSERYSPQAQTLFLMMLDAKKKEFAKAFERFAAQAKLSQGGLGVGLENDVAFDESFDGKRREELIDMLPKEEVYNARRKMTNQQIKERLKEIQREKINNSTQEKEAAQAHQDVDQSPDSKTSPNQARVDEQNTPSNPETDNNLITDEGQINRDYGTIENPNTVALGDYFAEQFEAGKRYDNIGQARRKAGQLLHGKNNIPPAQFKAIDEAIELGVVKTARKTVADMREDGKNDKEIFKALVDLYQRQPNLSTRTSTSVEQQAYSTPAPIAFLASRLAGINGKTTVYEPTAGNGMLLMEAAPRNAIVNELNVDRASRLKSQGFEVTEQDATGFEPAKNTDVVIENPPFGRVRKNGNNETVEFDIDGFNTKELDQAIVVKSLQALKDNGRAVLIIGGKQGNDAARKTKYRAASQIQFWKYLSDNYNIRDHFSIDGKMWTRQGAGYPVDVIVLDNQGGTKGYTFPGGKPPRVYSSFEQLEELLNEQQVDTGRVSPGDAVAGEGRGTDRESDAAIRADGRIPAENVSGRDRPGSERGRESGRTDRDSQNNAASVAEQRTGELERTRRDSARSNGQETGSNRRDASGRTVAEQNNDVAGVERRDVSTETEDMGRSGGIHQDGSDQLGGNNRAGLVESQQERPKKEKPLKPTQYQTPYQKASALPSLGTLVPKNMATAVKNAFAAFKKEHGNIDSFVAKELGYNEAELGNHFAAEQVDAIGLAISNLKKDAGFIIGDQTGIGKGRVNAAIIRWAKRNGKVPVFITMNPQLYGDMVRDLQDIGMPGFNPLTTNVLTGSDAIELPDGRKLKTKASPKHKQLLQKVLQDGLGEDYDAIFTTYNQLDSSGDNFRRRFMEAIAPKALFILDEAHNAGGTQGQQRKAKDAAPSRAQFVRDLLKSSPNGVFYSSATYAKRPDVMDLYMKTDMRHAVNDGESLGEAINRGGIPMQQIVAAQLAQSGQYLRRERTWEGADVETHSVKTDTKRADACADAMRAIMEFDRAKQEALGKLQDKEAGAGLNVGDNSAANESGMSSIGFSSIMHNLISQSTLSQKVDAIVDACDTAIKNGEKPVITLSNTMGSAIEEYADVNKIAVGDPINITFEDMFMRYLEKTRTIVKTEGAGNRKKEIERRQLTDAELGPHAVALYNKAMETIRKSGVNQLPVSFIDMIEEGLRKKGISTGEITGRKVGVDYSGAIPVLARKSNTTSDKINTVNSFNSGGLDAVILNSSGSTGISLHASEKFKDQRRRTMIVAQPDGNIDVFMQTLGRIFRTGQVVPPKYQLLFTDIPAEKRQAAVLAKKMASLNANTSAAKDSDASFKNIPDFMNKYGDRVAMQIIKDNPALHEKMGSPLDKKDNSKGTDSIDGSMQKLTGYIPLLPVKEQKVIYDQLEAAYKDLTEQLEAMGALDLEAKPMPLDAKLINEEEITPKKDVEGTTSPFTAAAKLGKYDVKKLGKPLPLEKVKEMVSEGNAIDPRDDRAAYDTWLKNKLKNISDKRKEDFKRRSEDNYNVLKVIANTFKPGVPVLIENKVDGQKIAGVVTNVSKKGKADNPVALGNYHVEIAVADAAKKLTFPFSQIADPSATNYSFEPHGITRDEVYKAIEDGQSEGRESVYIATGNVLAAFERLEKGRVIVFEDHEGNLTPGLMLPRTTSISEILNGLDVTLMPAQAMDFLKKCSTKSAMVKTEDKACAITRTGEDTFDMAVPASKAKGGQYFLNGAILKAAGKDFVKSGNSMVLRGLSGTKMQAVLDAMAGQNTGLIADNNKEVAREVSGQKQITTGSFAARKKQSDLEAEIEAGAGIQIDGRTVWNNPNASIRPGQFLPSRNANARGTSVSTVSKAVDALNRMARNAANTEVVQSFAELPKRLCDIYANNATSVEAVYDQRTRQVYFVADNISDGTRAAEVWAHEQIVHHGLRGMLNEGERTRVMNQLWMSMGGMGNPLVKQIADRYGLKPRSNQQDRLTLMEEVVANLAEGKQLGKLSGQQESMWKKVVRAIARIWNKIVERVTGRSASMGYEQVDNLLKALGRYVIDGIPAGGQRVETSGTMASVGEGQTNSYGVPMERITNIEGNISKEDVQAALLELAGKDLPNIIEGLTAQVNSNQRGKLISEKARRKSREDGFTSSEHSIAAQKIANIWKWSAEMRGVGGSKEKVADVNVRRFISSVRVNGRDAFAWLTVKETPKGLRIYSLQLMNNKKLREQVGNADANATSNTPTQSLDEIIDRLKSPVNEADAPLASIGKDISEQVKSLFSTEAIAAGIRNLRKIAGRGVSDDVQDILDNPDMGKLVRKNDISFWERCFKVPHWIAKDHKEAAGIYDRQQQRTEERMAATNSDISKMSILFDQDKKNSLNDKEYKALAGMIHKWDGKEIAELKNVNKFRVKGKLPNGKSEYEINPDYRNKFKAWLDSQPEAQKVKSAFLQVREALDDAFIKAYTRMSKMEGIDPTELEKYRNEFGNIHNYFPHSRKGKYYVMATEGEGKDRKVVYRKHFDVPLGSSIREEWAKIVAEQQKNYPNAKWHNPGENEKLPDDILGAPIDPQAMEQIIKSAAGKIGDKQQAAEVSKLMLQGVADILKARGFGSHGIHRQNIAGYEMENIKEVLYDYFSGLNGWLTKMDAAADFTRMLGEIDARKQPRLWQYMSQYTKDMLRNSDNIDRVAGRIKTIAFAWYLGANMKTAIVNSTQNIIDGVPRLQQYVTGGAGRWLKAAGDTIGMKYTGNGIKGARNLSAEEEKMLERLYGNGIISAAYMDELQGQLINSPVVKGWRKFVAVLGKPMGMVECFNRASLALAAYRAARAGAWRGYALKEFGLQPGQKMSAEQAEQFAAMLVRDSHFEYGKGNMPEIMRSTWAGRALSPMYTFRSFGANQLNLWYRALTKEGTEGKIFVAKSLGATIALGGLASFPFFATLSALCTALSGDDEDWQTKIKNQLPENDMVRDMVCYGLPAITGFSIAGSLRMETPFTDSFKKGKTFKDAMNDSIAGLIGIPYDLAVNRPNKYLEARKYGQDMKAIEALAPTFVSNLVQAYRMNTQGQTGKTGAPIIDKTTGKQNKFSMGEAIGKSFGFQPVSSARSYDDYQATQRAKEVRDDKLNELTMLFMKTLDGKGPQYRLKAIQEMRKWNEEMKDKPGMNINLKQIINRVNRRRPKQKKAS